MSLKTTYGDANRVIDKALTVTYSRVLISGSWTGTTSVASGSSTTYYYMWEYHRRATKSYRYVGMDDSAKNACVEAMIQIYNRPITASFWNETTSDGHGLGSWSDSSAGTNVTAEICPSRNDDGSWDVIVDVREDDTRMRKTWNSVTPSTLFSSESSRSYDGETE